MSIKYSSLLLIGLLWSCKTKTTEILVENSSTINLEKQVVTIQREEVKKFYKEGFYPVVLSSNGDTLISQLSDVDGDLVWDHLHFLVDIEANSKQNYRLEWSKTASEFSKLTNVRFGVRDSANETLSYRLEDVFYPNELPWTNGYQPYQADGPMWENDKVGFRSYLDGRNSKDVFGKKISAISPDSVGIDKNGFPVDNYHQMDTWGRDILSVGNSVGLGGFAVSKGDSLYRVGVITTALKGNVDSTKFKILNNGSIFTSMVFDYKGWDIGSKKISAKETIEIVPGEYAYKNTVNVYGLNAQENVVIGLVNSRTNKPLHVISEVDNWIILSTHDLQTYEKEWYLGLALVIPKKDYISHYEAPKEGNVSNTFLAKVKNGTSYYSIATWELTEERFRDESQFHDYLKSFAKKLNSTLTITVL